MARQGVQIAIRVSPEIKAWLDEQRGISLRSMNNEIVLALREKMERSSATAAANE